MNAQAIRNFTFEVSATARTYNSTHSIIDFRWPLRPPNATDQWVYRKLKEDYKWDTVYQFIPAADSTYSDTILTGTSFEYRFEKDTALTETIIGYINAGHRIPAVTARGKILLIIDSTHKTYLDTAIRIYRNDLTGDGWQTQVTWFSPSTTVAQIKDSIVNSYNADPANVKSVVLIGDLAVPYSGDFNASGEYPPDGHTTGNPPSHEGAWPADCYYGDVYSSSWTDASVTNNLGARTANNNTPGDGKFDQTTIPNLITLQVGRIDLSGMTSFSLSERDLLKQYFTKNHNFKHKISNIRERCLIDDNFGLSVAPEAFGNNAYRNMSTLINSNSTQTADYLNTLDTSDYLWSFGMGNGGYTSCTGVGNTSQFAAKSLKSVFTGLFGSYFGDWDNADNLLRAPLACNGNTLNSFWVGRPHWFFHHMGLGETIGYSTLRTQNNFDTMISYFLYPTLAASYLQIHVALLGDPTVRMQPVSPARQFSATQDSCSTRFRLGWAASTDTAVHNYYIFRANHIDSSFSLLSITGALTFVDSTPLSGNNVYMLRGEKLQTSGSGTYFNLSQGIFDTINTANHYVPVADAGTDTTVCENTYIRIGAPSSNSIHTIYQWNPVSFPRDTTTVQATNSGNRIQIVTDTISQCIQRDTMVLTVLPAPLSETLSVTPFNACGDTATWSSTLNNGSGFNYAWNFEQGHPDTMGLSLGNPGMIAYDTSGNFKTLLILTDTITQCQNEDSMNYTVNCLQALPVVNVHFACEPLWGGLMKISFRNLSENSYYKYIIEGFNRSSEWVQIKVIDGQSQSGVETTIVSSETFNYARLTGVNVNKDKIVLSTCKNKHLDPDNVIYPVPVENLLHINCGYYPNSTFSFKVYNSFGQSLELPVISETSELITLDVGNIASGNYIVLLMIDGEIKSMKFNKL